LFLTGLYGQEASKYVILYNLLAANPLLWFAGTLIASYYGCGQKLTIKESLKITANLPPVWALTAGFIVNYTGLRMPNFLLKTLDLVSMPVIPLMIFSVGLALSAAKLKHAIVVNTCQPL
jgi:predicted permease